MGDLSLNELNVDNIGSWPAWVKTIAIVTVFFVIIFLGYWFEHSVQLDNLTRARVQEAQLIKSIEQKQRQVVNLTAYRQQLNSINTKFKNLLSQLPTESEVPGLLEDITKTGVENGLEFKLFKPLPEIKTDFYSELPIQISVVGNYHQIAQFISKVANLDRIVTLHNFTVKPAEALQKNGQEKAERLSGKLILDITAKTYRYTDENKTSDENEIKNNAK